MSEVQRVPQEVAAIFREGTSLAIPQFEIPKIQRLRTETNEQALYRLCIGQGITPSIDQIILNTDRLPDIPLAYIMNKRGGELPESQLLVPHDEILEYIETQTSLNRVDQHLLRSARRLIET